jgi:hypothetical protein
MTLAELACGTGMVVGAGVLLTAERMIEPAGAMQREQARGELAGRAERQLAADRAAAERSAAGEQLTTSICQPGDG